MWYIAIIAVLISDGMIGRSMGASSKGPWSYVGCYKDKRPRDLTSYHKDTSLLSGMSLDRCFKFCSGYKTLYMALQSGNVCRCDNNYGRYGKAKESDCSKRCTKSGSKDNCGGDWFNSIYKIRDGPATQITQQMMSLQTSATGLTFTALGDWGSEGSAQRDVAKQLGYWSDKNKAAFTAAIGDNFYEYGVSSADDKRFKTTWRDVYTHKSLQKPWLVIEGNHDYLMDNAPHQVMYADRDKRWVMPSLYYSMHYKVGNQDVHFIFLDTDPIRNDYEYHQYNWFKKELETSRSQWIIVMGHHPVYSSGSHGSESSTSTMYKYIRSEMVKHKVALYICGHDHILEHLTEPSGVVDYVISGAGSKRRTSKSSSATKNLKKKRVKSKYLKRDYGFVGMKLEGNTIRVYYMDRKGRQIYSFTKLNPRKSSNTIFG